MRRMTALAYTQSIRSVQRHRASAAVEMRRPASYGQCLQVALPSDPNRRHGTGRARPDAGPSNLCAGTALSTARHLRISSFFLARRRAQASLQCKSASRGTCGRRNVPSSLSGNTSIGVTTASSFSAPETRGLRAHSLPVLKSQPYTGRPSRGGHTRKSSRDSTIFSRTSAWHDHCS